MTITRLLTVLTAIGFFATLPFANAIAEDQVGLDIYSIAEQDLQSIAAELADRIDKPGQGQAKLQAAVIPTDDADKRLFIFWTGVRPTVPASQQGMSIAALGKPQLSLQLQNTDFSTSDWKNFAADGVLELRTYIATDDHLANLHARFRDHTVKLFERHGIKNVAYYQLASSDKVRTGELLKAVAAKGKDAVTYDVNAAAAPRALIYVIAHNSEAAAATSFAAFGKDEDWKSARSDSENKAGGSLTVNNGVKNLFLKSIK